MTVLSTNKYYMAEPMSNITHKMQICCSLNTVHVF